MTVAAQVAPHTTEADTARLARCRLEVDLSAIRHNLDLVRRFAPTARVMAVMKADAYGAGAATVGTALESAGVDAFGVDNVAEGLLLRQAGLVSPIVVFDGDVPENAAQAIVLNLVPGIANEELLVAYDVAARRRGRRVPAWLVANIGFNRSGPREESAFRQFVRRAASCAGLEVQAIYGHLTDADGDARVSEEQIVEYRSRIVTARGILQHELQTSLFASHGLVRFARANPTTWVRPGLLLLGEHVLDDELIQNESLEEVNELQAALRLRARIVQVIDFNSTQGVGYGRRFSVPSGHRLATLSIGFGNGYPYRTSGLNVIAGGKLAPVAGDAGMDATQIDVTDVDQVGLYGWVTLLGVDGQQRIRLATLASACNSTPYQILAALRCGRVYSN